MPVEHHRDPTHHGVARPRSVQSLEDGLEDGHAATLPAVRTAGRPAERPVGGSLRRRGLAYDAARMTGLERAGWVAVLAEAEGLRWVLERSRMAWTEASARRAAQIRPGDALVLYVARGAFHNPTRDESRLVALAEVTTPVRRLRQPVELAGRTFVVGCDLRFEARLPERGGVPVRPLVPRLSFVRRKEVWGQYFRSGLVRVPPEDLEVLARAVREAASDRLAPR